MQTYNYLQDLYGNSGITTTDLQRRKTKRYKKLTEKERLNASMKFATNDHVTQRRETNLKKKVSISYKEKINISYKKLN